MNIIEEQALDFLRFNLDKHEAKHTWHKDFIDDVKYEVLDYSKESHKLIFLRTIEQKLKVEWDKHLADCRITNCRDDKFYKNSLFFLNEEVESLHNNLPETEFNNSDLEWLKSTISTILDELNSLKMGQEVVYDEVEKSFNEIQEHLYLDKTTWTELIIGKITSLVTSGVIDVNTSKKLIAIAEMIYIKYINK